MHLFAANTFEVKLVKKHNTYFPNWEASIASLTNDLSHYISLTSKQPIKKKSIINTHKCHGRSLVHLPQLGKFSLIECVRGFSLHDASLIHVYMVELEKWPTDTGIQ